jgi:methyl-accepting chemotaxis protein
MLIFMPVITTIIVLFYMETTSYIHYKSHDQTEKLIDVSTKVSSLVHSLQRERGMSVGYIESKGKKFNSQLVEQKLKSDKIFLQIKDQMKNFTFSKNYLEVQKKYEDTLLSMEELLRLRESVKSFSISSKLAMQNYTKINKNLLQIISSTGRSTHELALKRCVLSYYNFLLSKELSGQEGAIGFKAFSINNIDIKSKLMFSNLIQSQNIYFKLFNEYATEKNRKFFKNFMNSYANQELSKMRKILLEKDSNFGIDAKKWFKNMSVKIKNLHEIDNHLANNLIKTSQELTSSAISSLVIVLFVGLFILVSMLIVSIFISKHIVSRVHTLENGLLGFLGYLSKESSEVKKIELEGKDEFAKMSYKLNAEIEHISKMIENDKKVLEEIDYVSQQVSNGFFGHIIKSKSDSDELNHLIKSINKMLDSTKSKLDSANLLIAQYTKGNFDFKLSAKEDENVNGDFGTFIAVISLLGERMSELFAMIQRASNTLNDNTGVLKDSSSTILEKSDLQVTSLENVIKLMEEISTLGTENMNHVKMMKDLSQNVSASVVYGKELAYTTSKSSKILDNNVEDILDAIKIINQISFQTNILSLNAAVEASTAGEAGKGFAVVAAEVRNLATKSKEAAQKIKDIVEDTKENALLGVDVSSKMAQCFDELNEKIYDAQEAMNKVAEAGEKQKNSTENILSSFNSLKNFADENAQISNGISILTKDVNNLSSELSSIANRAVFDSSVKGQICDSNFNATIGDLKHYHLVFRADILSKVASDVDVLVPSSQECDIGIWIEKQERTNMPYTNTHEWKTMIKFHDASHEYAQQYVNSSLKGESPEVLASIAKSLKEASNGIFAGFDFVKAFHCEEMKKKKESLVEVE